MGEKRILIAYADESMKYSLKQLGIQARYIKQIDKVILYNEKDLPIKIKESPLMTYKRGGGYWIWKPYLIWRTLQDFPEGTKLCYIDAGCSIWPGKEWEIYWDILDDVDTLLFQYDKRIPKWGKQFNCSSSSTECWTKKKTLLFFDNYLKETSYHNFSQIWGGLLFCKGKSNIFVKEWLEITINHPELIIDPDMKELKKQHPSFNGNHRHDQSIITPIAYLYKENNIKILPEIFDENKISKIIFASRNRITKRMYRKIFFKYHFQGILGTKRYEKIKKLLFIFRKRNNK